VAKRTKINGGEKQLYGTQFKNVDPINKTVELADTDDIENLDRRRMCENLRVKLPWVTRLWPIILNDDGVTK